MAINKQSPPRECVGVIYKAGSTVIQALIKSYTNVILMKGIHMTGVAYRGWSCVLNFEHVINKRPFTTFLFLIPISFLL